MNIERRMAAEGLPGIPTIAQVILEQSNQLKTGGICHEQVNVSSALLAKRNLLSESYHGGYLYPGWQGTLDGHPLLAHYRNWVKDGRLRTDEYAAYLLTKLNEAPIGAALIISNTLETTEHAVYTKTSYTEWTCTETYNESFKNWENQGLFLPEGIRAKVAEVLKCHMSSTFHRAFDAATHLINYGELKHDKSA